MLAQTLAAAVVVGRGGLELWCVAVGFSLGPHRCGAQSIQGFSAFLPGLLADQGASERFSISE